MPSNKSLTVQERSYYYKAIQSADEAAEFVICDPINDTLFYTDKIHSNERITGRPTDEELTRALIVVNLIKKYNYSPDDLELELSVEYSGRNITTTAFQNDIAIKDDTGTYKSIIEVKRITSYTGVNDNAIKNQLFHPFENHTKLSRVKELYYVTCDIPVKDHLFPLICIGIDTDKVSTYVEWVKMGRPTFFLDISLKGTDKPKYDNYRKSTRIGDEQKHNKDLNGSITIDTIRRVWRNIWDAIWGGTLESNTKFENFNKILLAKIYDERKTVPGSYYRFQRKVKAGELQTNADLAADIDLLYRKAYIEYFCKNNTTDLKDVKGIDFEQFSYDLTAKCVDELYHYSFANNRYKNVDILGEFYEMVIRDSFKQTKGLFLTHPNIVLFILQALDVEQVVNTKLQSPDEDARYRLPFVIDPSCGTGTFLVYYMNLVQKYIEENDSVISNGDTDIEEFIRREMQGDNKYKWVKDYVFGIDCEPVLAMASQINQILHGDGSTNIYCSDGLRSFDQYADLDVIGAHNILSSNIKRTEYYDYDVIEKFDIIISNPPFNVSINKASLSDRFCISGKSEAYFLERWYQLLKPKGRLGVVLPESFFSVEDDSKGRVFLYKHFNIKFIVSLPNFAFLPHTPTNTSLLFAEKKSADEEKNFHRYWEEYSTQFEVKYSKITAGFPKAKSITSLNQKTITENIYHDIEKEFGENFIVFPFFTDEFFSNKENYNEIKKKIRKILTDSKERWVLQKVLQTINDSSITFKNYSVENIGYKAGKKGAKEKPNELMNVRDEKGNQIFNLKFAHDWKNVEAEDLNTVLGLIRRDVRWQ